MRFDLAEPATLRVPAGAAVIDCDLHNAVPSAEALFPYLDDHWREVIQTSQFKGPTDTAYPPGAATSLRPSIASAGGPPPGSTLSLVQEHVLDPLEAEVGILTCVYAVDSIKNPDAAVAVSAAVNDWQIEEWLRNDIRLRASIVVPSSQPTLAAREIDRVAAHPSFVQVVVPVRSFLPYGNRNWYPLLEAVTRHDLALAIHFGGAPGNAPSPNGWPTYYAEEYVNMAGVFQAQLLSLVAEGAFETFPTLRVLCAESGFAWLPGFLWRFDKSWRGLRREIPWTRRLPSEYVREHVRFTFQPNDAPREPSEFLRVLDQLGSDELLLYSTDYPHWHGEHADAGLTALSSDALEKILATNARSFYGLEGRAGA